MWEVKCSQPVFGNIGNPSLPSLPSSREHVHGGTLNLDLYPLFGNRKGLSRLEAGVCPRLVVYQDPLSLVLVPGFAAQLHYTSVSSSRRLTLPAAIGRQSQHWSIVTSVPAISRGDGRDTVLELMKSMIGGQSFQVNHFRSIIANGEKLENQSQLVRLPIQNQPVGRDNQPCAAPGVSHSLFAA